MKFKKFKFKKVKSTNNTAIRIIKETKYNLGMVVAESQANGRGQYGRKWISSKGNLFVSFFNELNKKKISINKSFGFLNKIFLLVNDESNFLTKRQLIFVIALIDIFFLFSSLKKETNKFPFDDIHFLPYCPLPFDWDSATIIPKLYLVSLIILIAVLFVLLTFLNLNFLIFIK